MPSREYLGGFRDDYEPGWRWGCQAFIALIDLTTRPGGYLAFGVWGLGFRVSGSWWLGYWGFRSKVLKASVTWAPPRVTPSTRKPKPETPNLSKGEMCAKLRSPRLLTTSCTWRFRVLIAPTMMGFRV